MIPRKRRYISYLLTILELRRLHTVLIMIPSYPIPISTGHFFTFAALELIYDTIYKRESAILTQDTFSQFFLSLEEKILPIIASATSCD